MYKIAIIGSENSHCGHFAATLAPKNGEKLFPELELIGVCGDNVSNEAVAKNCACEWYTNDPTAFLGKVDCVMVTSRHGGVHLEYARPYIEAGCDVWIDKPITASVEDAREMVRLVKEKGVLLCGGSSLAGAEGTVKMKEYVAANAGKISGGHVTAPINLVNEYGNFWFYADHLAEISLAVFGWDPKWVQAVGRNDKGVTALVGYENYNISNHFCEGMYQYGGTVVTKGGIHTQIITLDDAYANECRVFARMLRTGKMHGTYEQMAQPVFYMDALYRSMQTGEKVAVAQAVVD
jgi:predicted dehydrogenase